MFFLVMALFSVSSAADVNETVLIDTNVPFIENQGQTDQSVSYYADTFYGTSYITNDGITHKINRKDNTSLVVKEEFLDKNGKKIIFNSIGEQKSTATISYLKGNESSKWNIGSNSYKIINLGELYPGIIVKLKANSANIEKLFYIKPSVNPDNINIPVLGADKITIDKNGYLNIISNRFKNVSLTKPIAYQNNKEINTNYIVNEKTYKFKVD